MNPNPSMPATAKIYQFPTKISANAGHRARQPQSTPDHRALQLAAVEFGSGWYHEAALQAETVRKS